MRLDQNICVILNVWIQWVSNKLIKKKKKKLITNKLSPFKHAIFFEKITAGYWHDVAFLD